MFPGATPGGVLARPERGAGAAAGHVGRPCGEVLFESGGLKVLQAATSIHIIYKTNSICKKLIYIYTLEVQDHLKDG